MGRKFTTNEKNLENVLDEIQTVSQAWMNPNENGSANNSSFTRNFKREKELL